MCSICMETRTNTSQPEAIHDVFYLLVGRCEHYKLETIVSIIDAHDDSMGYQIGVNRQCPTEDQMAKSMFRDRKF